MRYIHSVILLRLLHCVLVLSIPLFVLNGFQFFPYIPLIYFVIQFTIYVKRIKLIIHNLLVELAYIDMGPRQ